MRILVNKPERMEDTMKKLWISLTLLAILVLAFAGLANAEGMQDTVPGQFPADSCIFSCFSA